MTAKPLLPGRLHSAIGRSGAALRERGWIVALMWSSGSRVRAEAVHGCVRGS